VGQNPINLAVRFLLEIAALIAIGYWGWTQFDGLLRYLLTIGLPLLAATVWGTFRVPGDASASGKAPVAVPGWLRLILELALFSFATWSLFQAGPSQMGLTFGVITLIHYILSYDRIGWLFKTLVR
jgi:hypothetical protein